MTSMSLESRNSHGLSNGVSRYTPDILNEDLHPSFSTGPFSRRAFLKSSAAIAGGAAVASVVRRAGLTILEASPQIIPPESTQFDVPSNLRLIRVNPGDTLNGLVHNDGLKANELMDLNGITDPRSLKSGEAIVVPISLQTTNNRKIDSFDGLAPFQPVVARVVPNPDIATGKDFDPWEQQALNRYARDASLELPILLGMGGASRAGFFRIVRPSETEVTIMSSLGAAGMVARPSAVCSGNLDEGGERDVKASLGCGSNGLLTIYLLTDFSESPFQSLEKQKPGFGRLAYLDAIKNIIRHEMLHLYFGDLIIPPFDPHELIYALSDFGLTIESDKGFGDVSRETGYRVGQRFYRRDRMEWYFVRQFPRIMSKLYPWAQERRAKKVAITENDVRTMLRSVQPDFSGWEQEFKRPLDIDSVPTEGKHMVWGASQADSQVFWYAPVWRVRWPNLDEKLGGRIGGWIEDEHEQPRNVHGNTYYKSWKFLGKSNHGEVPELANTATAVGFQVINGYMGQMPNPTYPSAKPVAWWR